LIAPPTRNGATGSFTDTFSMIPPTIAPGTPSSTPPGTPSSTGVAGSAGAAGSSTSSGLISDRATVVAAGVSGREALALGRRAVVAGAGRTAGGGGGGGGAIAGTKKTFAPTAG